jgi:type VI secretion system protein ImpK
VQEHNFSDSGRTFGVNGISPLLDACFPVVLLATELRKTATVHDVSQLRAQIVELFRKFESQCEQSAIAREVSHSARYLLCVYIDECVLSTPWGNVSEWSTTSMLSTFYNETWGGETFFDILERAQRDHQRHSEILKLIYVLLSFGFKGKYAVASDGPARITEIKQRIYQQIDSSQTVEKALSSAWQGEAKSGPAIARYVPFWVVGAVLIFTLSITYLAFAVILESSSGKIVDHIERLKESNLGTSTALSLENARNE